MEGMALLDRAIRVQLYGEDGRSGLIRALLACQTWDDINRQKGKIEAFEGVLDMMEKIARQIYAQDEPRAQQRAH